VTLDMLSIVVWLLDSDARIANKPSSRDTCTRNVQLDSSQFGQTENLVLIAHCVGQTSSSSCFNANGAAGRPGPSRSPMNKSSLHRRLWRATSLWKQLALLS